MFKKYILSLPYKQIFRYLLAGGTAFGVEYISFLLLLNVVSAPLILSNTASYVLGFTCSFLLNRGWTFKSGQQYKWTARQQLSFYIVLAVFNLGASNLTVYGLSALIPAEISKLVAVGMIAFWNFIIFRTFIFKTSRPQA